MNIPKNITIAAAPNLIYETMNSNGEIKRVLKYATNIATINPGSISFIFLIKLALYFFIMLPLSYCIYLIYF